MYNNKMRRNNSWSDQEDKLLVQLYNQTGCFQKWKVISENFGKNGFRKNEIQCRQRFVNKLNPQLRKDKFNVRELKLLFKYYDQYGPLWSVFQTLIVGRSQNFLKNKFYSTLRTLVRSLISITQEIMLEKINICSSALSSKILVDMYEGKKNFRRFKGYFSSLLTKLQFQVDIQKISSIKDQINIQIIQKLKQQITKQKDPNTINIKKEKNQRQKCSKKNQLNIITRIDYGQNLQLHIKSLEQIKQNNQIDKRNTGTQTLDIKIQQSQCYSFYMNLICPLNILVPIWNYNTIYCQGYQHPL